MNFFSRRSIRKYKNQEVEKEKINEILEVALVAPSGRNRKPCEFLVIENPEMIKKLDLCKYDKPYFASEANKLIVIIAKEVDTWVEDCSIATTFIQLKAHELGLGTCWMHLKEKEKSDGSKTEENVKALLNIPSEYRVLNMVAIGYPFEDLPSYDKKDINYNKIHFDKF